MTIHDYPAAAVPWPAALQWTRRELRRYLKAASDPTVRTLPTRCPPWNVASLTAHLAATFRRFADLLDRARAGDLHPPFPPNHLPEENLRAVREFSGDPLEQLSLQANRFLGSVGACDEPMANQRGTIPVGLQMMFALNELAVHHDDLAHAAGESYRPAEQVVQALVSMYSAVFGLPASHREDPWARLLLGTGRSVGTTCRA
jgi:uncharacterized protein (TIGR03083 family)